jgi:hypothetical protein
MRSIFNAKVKCLGNLGVSSPYGSSAAHHILVIGKARHFLTESLGGRALFFRAQKGFAPLTSGGSTRNQHFFMQLLVQAAVRLAKSHMLSTKARRHLPGALTGEQHAGRVSQILLVAQYLNQFVGEGSDLRL